MKLIPLDKSDWPSFIEDCQASFALAVDKEEDIPTELIPPTEDLLESLQHPNAQSFFIEDSGHRVGGVVLQISADQHNHLDFFYISVSDIGKGYGSRAWYLIEESFPETKVWETVTPYFEKRNIAFYLKKCGFKIIDIFPFNDDSDELMFTFEKMMIQEK
ncbi:GNAT family N-acetyltransferase [Streptococcus saliviloxodontae]|uniref:N-acetyltransferase domain-containing protein n=1 Tax=Streptococcus saliviloxodontae TaxID=1349416 RepID=A0ABS2PJ57_9STRE|nr:GNAT family N-acetyltransferase [Streptococcus saliviloxodontae]MBM7635312.1 hypothetical protein [Streptococcus saliviloxodontae]